MSDERPLSNLAVEYLRQNDPILAIKAHREEYGLSLKIARDEVMAHPEYRAGLDRVTRPATIRRHGTPADRYNSIDDVLVLCDEQAAHEDSEHYEVDTYGDGWSKGRAQCMRQIADLLRGLKRRGLDLRPEIPAEVAEAVAAYRQVRVDKGPPVQWYSAVTVAEVLTDWLDSLPNQD